MALSTASMDAVAPVAVSTLIVSTFMIVASLWRTTQGALMALMPLVTGGRSGEIRDAQVRDADAGGSTLWLEGKTAHKYGRRRGIVWHEAVADRLRALAADRPSLDPLWTEGRSDVYLLRWVRLLCDEAKVPRACPHGLRGTAESLRVAAGEDPDTIARACGHARAVQRQHYVGGAAEAAAAAAHATRRFGVMQGGKP